MRAHHVHAWPSPSRRASALSLRCRKMFSTMITEASTISPKSIAPDRQQVGRLAAQHHQRDGEGQRERNRAGDDERAAQIAEESPLQQEDQQRRRRACCAAPCASSRGSDRSGRRSARCARRAAGRRELLIVSTSASTRSMVGMLCCAAAHEHDALDDVVVVVVAGDAQPRLVARRCTVGDVADADRHAAGRTSPWCWRMSSIEWIRPTPRTTAACGPMLTVWPPTLTLLLLSACSTCGSDRP